MLRKNRRTGRSDDAVADMMVSRTADVNKGIIPDIEKAVMYLNIACADSNSVRRDP